MSHAILPPSSAEQWVNCPGWVEMTAFYPNDEESESSKIGTVVHELGAKMIESSMTCEIPNTYSQDMIDCAKQYALYCLGLIEHYPDSKWYIEHHIDIPYVHKENSGTPDFVLVDEGAQVIHIVDYKNGRGIVEAYENWQLLDYLVGTMWKHGVTEDTNPPEWKLFLTIVQPNAFHPKGTIRTWQLNPHEVRPYATRLKNAAHEALSGNAKCHAGEHCRYCSALTHCQSAIDKAMTIFDVAKNATPFNMELDAMAVQYEMVNEGLKLLKYLSDSYETQLVSAIRLGKNVKGWILEPKSGNLEWNKPLEEVFGIGDLMGIDLRKATEAITPTQAKAKGLDPSVLAEYSSRKNQGVKLAKFDGQTLFKPL